MDLLLILCLIAGYKTPAQIMTSWDCFYVVKTKAIYGQTEDRK